MLARTLSAAKCKNTTESSLNIKRGVGGRDWLVHISGKFKVMPARMAGTHSTKKKKNSGLCCSLRYSRLCFFSALASLLVRISLDYSPGSSRLTFSLLSCGKIPLF